MYCNWELDNPSFADDHINVLELLTVYHAIKRWGHLWAGLRILVCTDNTATMSALNKGTSRSRAMMPIVRDIFWCCVKFECSMVSTHLAGSLNVLADRISRLDDLKSAHEAHALLSNSGNEWVYCKKHMSEVSFIFLQGRWRESLLS